MDYTGRSTLFQEHKSISLSPKYRKPLVLGQGPGINRNSPNQVGIAKDKHDKNVHFGDPKKLFFKVILTKLGFVLGL